MLENNPYCTIPKYWNDENLEYYISKNKYKKTSFLIWSPNKITILKQIKWLIENSIEVILSELLPDEIPGTSLNAEYNYLLKRLVYIPPHVELYQSKSKGFIQTKEIVIITDSLEYLFPSTMKEQSKKILTSLQNSIDLELIILNNDNSFENAINATHNAKLIFLNTKDPVFTHYCARFRDNKGLQLIYRARHKTGSPFRYISAGINYTNENYIDEKFSLRMSINKLLKVLKHRNDKVDLKNDTYKRMVQCNKFSIKNIVESELYQNSSNNKLWKQALSFKPITFIDTDKEYIENIKNRYLLKSILSFIIQKVNKENELDLIDKDLDAIHSIMVSQIMFKQKSWILEKYIFEIIKVCPNITNHIIIYLNYKHEKLTKAEINFYGYLGEQLLFASHMISSNSSYTTSLFETAMEFLKMSKHKNSREYFECFEFVLLMNESPRILNDHFKKLFKNQKTNKLSIKALSRITPLLLEPEQLVSFTIQFNLCKTEVSLGVWKSHGLIYHDLIYNVKKIKTSSVLKIFDILTTLFSDQNQLPLDMIFLSIFLKKEHNTPPHFFHPNDRMNIALCYKTHGEIENARNWIKSINTDSNDIELTLILAYHQYSVGLYDECKSEIHRLNIDEIKIKINSDKSWTYSYSPYLSLYYKINGNENESIEFYRISECFNEKHNLIDFSFISKSFNQQN